jgi:hypothetical protein
MSSSPRRASDDRVTETEPAAARTAERRAFLGRGHGLWAAENVIYHRLGPRVPRYDTLRGGTFGMKRVLAIAGRLLLLCAVALTGSCIWNASPTTSPAPAPTAAAEPEPAPPPTVAPAPAPDQEKRSADLERQVAALEEQSASLERQIVGLELRLLEKEAQAEELETRLDEARRESANAMARARTLATRAEASAGIDEAESALQALPPLAPDQVTIEVTGLIDHAKAELAQQNYGGAVYLADQAQRTAAAAQTRFAAAEESAPRDGEQPFTLPLHLQTTANANVREGPGTGFGVLFTLPAESPLLAYSATEQWLRVADDSGRRGWIHQSLIRGRL